MYKRKEKKRERERQNRRDCMVEEEINTMGERENVIQVVFIYFLYTSSYESEHAINRNMIN